MDTEPEDELCETCDGTGVECYWVGTYGTYSCQGEAERTCTECEGTGLA